MAPVAAASAVGLDENPDRLDVNMAVMALLDTSYAEKCNALATAMAAIA